MSLIAMIGHIPIELNSAQELIFARMTSETRVVFFRHDSGTSTISHVNFLKETFKELTIELKAETMQYINPSEYTEPLPYIRQFIFRSGKIKETWNYYYSQYTVWEPKEQPKPTKIHLSKFIRRFRGNNRGRHWNRKRA